MITYNAPNNVNFGYHPDNSPYLVSVIHYGVMSFSFLLNTPERRGQEFSFSDFADIITKYYTLDNPQTREVVRCLRLAD